MNDQERADAWTGTDLEWWQDLERRWFGGQTQTDEQREALVGEMILQGKADADRAESALSEVAQLKAELQAARGLLAMLEYDEDDVPHTWPAREFVAAALSEAPATEGSAE